MEQQRYYEGLSAAQEAKIEELRGLVAGTVATSPRHSAFCTLGTYVRYLRARDWNVGKAAKMLAATLAWRSSYGVEELCWEVMKEESADGKLTILEHADKKGRPIVLMRPRNEERYSGNDERRMQWLVYTLEAACALAEAGAADGKMTWLIDFVGYTRKHQPPIKVTLHTLSLLQNHYPERLGLAVCFQPPLLFDIAWKIIKPFVDPKTHDKLVFLHTKDAAGRLPAHFNPAHIDDSLGGELPVATLWDYGRYEERMLALEAGPDAAAGTASNKEQEEAARAAEAVAEAGSGEAAEKEEETEAGSSSEADGVGTPSEAADAAAISSEESEFLDAEEGEADAEEGEAVDAPWEDAGAAAAATLP